MKKGFTLIELIGVITLIAAIMLIIVPTVDREIKKGKENMYREQINSIELSTKNWFSENNIHLQNNEEMIILLSQLKQGNFADLDIQNPIKKEQFPNDLQIKIQNIDGKMIYTVLEDTGTDRSIYNENIPNIVLKGDPLVYLELSQSNMGYTDDGVIARDQTGNILESTYTTSPNEINTTTKGIYTRTYVVTNNGVTNRINRTIIVKDTKAPTISFPDTVINVKLADATKYDYTSDVTVTDNSGEQIEVKVEYNFGAIPGTYTITYTATDGSGNISKIFRKINVTS